MKRLAGVCVYCMLVVISAASLHRSGDLSRGRHPWTNFLARFQIFDTPAFFPFGISRPRSVLQASEIPHARSGIGSRG